MMQLPRPSIALAGVTTGLVFLSVTASAAEGVRFSGPVDRRVVAAAIPNHATALKACYDRARSASPGINGRLLVSFVVNRSGAVSDVHIPEATVYEPVLETCVKEVVSTFSFPPSDASVTVTAPLVFRDPVVTG